MSRRSLPFVIVIAIYVFSVVLVNPRGEFPLNDDWSYTRSAFQFGTQGRLRVDEWSAMSLIGQAMYGGLLVKLFKPSFLVLRLSTLALSCGTALLLFAMLGRFGVRPGLAWIAVLSWIFNPIQFCLSFTFMTEIPFLFFVTLSLYLYTISLPGHRAGLTAAWAAALGFGFLIRQTAVLFAGPMILSLILESRSDFRAGCKRAALAASVFIPFAAGYYLWLLGQGGPTPATKRKFELLHHLTAEQLAGNSLGMLFYLSFLLLPLLIASIPFLFRLGRTFRPRAALAAILLWSGTGTFGLWWFHAHYSRTEYLPSRAFHAQMPFLLNVLYDSGLGPVTLDPTYYGSPSTPVHPQIWFLVTIAVALGLVVLGASVTLGLFKIRLWYRRPGPALAALCLALSCIAGFEIVFSHLQEGGLFDRHLLIAALPATLLLGLLFPTLDASGKEKQGKVFGAAAAGALVILAWFSIAATHDYLAWNRVRWDLGTGLLAQNVDPLKLSAGFEFNAWQNYDTFRARGNVGKVYYWWYDKRDYLISMKPEAGYRIVRQENYFSWLHRRSIPLYALHKQK